VTGSFSRRLAAGPPLTPDEVGFAHVLSYDLGRETSRALLRALERNDALLEHDHSNDRVLLVRFAQILQRAEGARIRDSSIG